MYENQKRPTIFVRIFNIKFHQYLPSGSQVKTWELTEEISLTRYSVYAHVQVRCNKGQSCTYRMQCQHIFQGRLKYQYILVTFSFFAGNGLHR